MPAEWGREVRNALQAVVREILPESVARLAVEQGVPESEVWARLYQKAVPDQLAP